MVSSVRIDLKFQPQGEEFVKKIVSTLMQAASPQGDAEGVTHVDIAWGDSATNFDFSMALHEMKSWDAGCARRAWVESGDFGTEKFVLMMPGLKLPAFNSQETRKVINDRTAQWIGYDTPLDCRPYFVIFQHGVWQPGWVPTTDDMFATDWFVVKRAKGGYNTDEKGNVLPEPKT